MINEKETLKKFHKIKPELTIEELLALLDGIVEKEELRTNIKDFDITSPFKIRNAEVLDNLRFQDTTKYSQDGNTCIR